MLYLNKKMVGKADLADMDISEMSVEDIADEISKTE